VSKTVLVTGCAGFLASHLIEHIFKTTDWNAVGLDRLDETSTLRRVGDTDAYKADPKRFRFVWHDLRAPINAGIAHAIGHVDLVLHLAASTHVDRSITNPGLFVLDNVVGTQHVLDYVRFVEPDAPVLVFSTDEVFGPAAPGKAFKEWDRYRASNPYAASKAAAEELTVAYANTYRLKTIITHCTNVFGERQHPEKFLPLVVRKILLGEQVLVHADAACKVPTSRFYIHARNVAAAVLHIVNWCEKPALTQTFSCAYGEKWNIAPWMDEIDSRELVERVAEILGRRAKFQLVNSVSNRPGHDMRYALDTMRLRHDIGFKMPVDFDHSLEKTVKWYAENPSWLEI
jgi:dTDP-glucose 4,6-dehydratase